MFRLRATHLRIVAVVALVACLAAAVFTIYARVAPAHAAATCVSYVEYDDIVPPSFNSANFNPTIDDVYPSPTKPDIWEVYYNLRVDAGGTGTLCAMQLVLRIFPQDYGKFWGPVTFGLTYQYSQSIVPGSELTTTAYCPYGGHVVLRTPKWFDITHGKYDLFSFNVNYGVPEAVGAVTV